jgi:hypothetical protein
MICLTSRNWDNYNMQGMGCTVTPSTKAGCLGRAKLGGGGHQTQPKLPKVDKFNLTCGCQLKKIHSGGSVGSFRKVLGMKCSDTLRLEILSQVS